MPRTAKATGSRGTSYRKKPGAGAQSASRPCLGGCGKPFMSDGPWQRICPKCSARNEHEGVQPPANRREHGAVRRKGTNHDEDS